MIKEIVKQAIQIKLTCTLPSPLISPAEFCCASGFAAKSFGFSEEFLLQYLNLTRIEEMREMIKPKLEEVMGAYEGDAFYARLLKLLLTCKVEGEVTEELRELFQMGME